MAGLGKPANERGASWRAHYLSQTRDSRRTFFKGKRTGRRSCKRPQGELQAKEGRAQERVWRSLLPRVEGWEAHRLHTWGPTPWEEKQSSSKTHSGVFLGDSPPGPTQSPTSCLRSSSEPPALEQTEPTHSWTLAYVASGLFPSGNEHMWVPLTRERDCLLSTWCLVQAQAHKGGGGHLNRCLVKSGKAGDMGLADLMFFSSVNMIH